ncbi:hypothetical protein [Mesorhizobium sp. B2-3-4]|uniref:phage adaptor protein n=1 Tax=Mesorhizobium sp. B2-3-4 TaxID=2589959 RepID=UPI00112A3F7F|nr:hypothetical protein [Mesorhizobium sp. B2-3-4]TPM41418.1 hypothetical protein FJ967_00325 [Mesorhizobium sp. B2-3-4]
MPTPAELVEAIKSLALVGATGDATVNVKVYTYLNTAYRQLYEMVAERYPWFVQTTQPVLMAAGEGTMDPQPLHILSVRDTGNNLAALTPTDVLTVESEYPGLDDTGNPSRYWVDGFTGLNSHPRSSTTLRVRFTPQANALSETSEESDIALQPVHHDALLWGTLKLMAYDERDKVIGAELAYNKDAHDEVLDRMWRYFESHAPKQKKQVQSYLN